MPRLENQQFSAENALSTASSADVMNSVTGFDEACLADGSIREKWQYLLGSLDQLGPAAIAERQRIVDKILRDDGATYNDYRGGGAARPWHLDPVPMLIDSQEWSAIEAGVRERAELLNMVFRDLYGERTLLKHGVIPPELVFGYRGFLRACQGISVPGEQQIIQYAADMVRTSDGEMRLISDRTQAPSGVGYALENRSVVSRVFPSLFRDSQVHRLTMYFQSLRLKLSALNPNGDLCNVVVLTPGAYNETYFEHVYLANYLGYPLVRGNDLTVRDGYVWIKTLEGLSRVDVIVRRVDDYYCDPVELKSNSQLGIPGLLEVIRSGRVVVANPLGSGVLENHGLLKYLPAAAVHFFGREPSLKSVPTYWCGDPTDLRYTLDNLPRLIVKTVFRGIDSNVQFGGDLSTEQLQTLRAAISAEPQRYVSQDYLAPSSAPTWENGQMGVRPTVLRSFAVAGQSSYIVMPGGLTRVGKQSNLVEISNKKGSISKDTWVLASEPEKRTDVTTGKSLTVLAPSAEGIKLPSRVVENMFWIGRYAERAESALRLIRTVFSKLNSAEPLDDDSQTLLLRSVTQLTCTYPGFMDPQILAEDPHRELMSITTDRDRAGGIMSLLTSLLNAADQVTELLSSDTQSIINDLHDEMNVLPNKLQSSLDSAPDEALDSMVTTLLALSGLVQESMIRGPAWHFLLMGRRIERVLQTTSLLRSLWVPVKQQWQEERQLVPVLLSVEALITYRRRYQSNMQMANGLDLLLLEPGNPRSIVFQLTELESHFSGIMPMTSESRLPSKKRLLLEATSSLRLADVALLSQAKTGDTVRTELDQLLTRTQYLLTEMATKLSEEYFDHSAGPQPLLKGDWGEEL